MLTLRAYQEQAESSLFAFLMQTRNRHPLVCMPTGTGKSLVIGHFIYKILSQWPNQRILALTHVKELLVQNSGKLAEIWPSAPFGIFSAGLKQRDTSMPVIFGGVASVVKNLESLGRFDIVMIDEAHLMNGEDSSMYGTIVSKLRVLNPQLLVIGFTATPYRTGQGSLIDIGIFTDIAVDMTTMQWFNWFIDNGYMSMLIPKRTNTELSISNVGIQAGEYNQRQLENAVDVQDVTYRACKETIELASDRDCWLTFATGVKHAEHVAEMFRNFGIPSEAVHSKMASKKRDRIIRDFKAGKIRNLVNKGVFTTGQDHPPIDLIVDLAPTMSTGLHVQKYGRGGRPFPGKINCLGLDFARNVQRLGPINDPLLPKARGSANPGVAPIRVCDQCGTYCHANAKVCHVCGFEFPFQIHIEASAGTDEIIKTEIREIKEFDVQRALYSKIEKHGVGIMKVNYVCGAKSYSEVVCLEHAGRAGHAARSWWKRRMGSEVAPPTVDEALRWVSSLAVPKRISVVVNRKYPEVVETHFEGA